MPKKGWKIPVELEQFVELFEQVIAHETLLNQDLDNYYVYITVDQLQVSPGTTQRRPGWHSDSYITKETRVNANKAITHTGEPLETDSVYVIADCIPTSFLPGPFSLHDINPEDCDAVLQRFEECAKQKTPITYPDYTILRLDPYAVHTPSINESSMSPTRTFIKISFSRNMYNKLGNAHNHLFDYNWPMVPRNLAVRNHPNTISGWNRADRDKFLLISPADVDFSKDTCTLAWAEPALFYAIKKEGVKAQPAVEGEVLFTEVDSFVVALNVARKNDWKITTKQGDQYFLSDKQFEQFYTEHADAQGFYSPRHQALKMVKLTQDVCFQAPWGSMQYVPAHSVLVYRSENDIYAIHKKNFECAYEVMDEDGLQHLSRP
jgi:hypothetical protein